MPQHQITKSILNEAAKISFEIAYSCWEVASTGNIDLHVIVAAQTITCYL